MSFSSIAPVPSSRQADICAHTSRAISSGVHCLAVLP